MAGDTVWIGVNAEVRGFMKSVSQAARSASDDGSKTLADGFRKGGENAGKSAAAGLQSQAKTIQAVSTKLGTARAAEATAAAKVSAEQAKLNALQSSGSATASQLSDAENRVATAKREHGDATTQVGRLQSDLNSAEQGGEVTSTALANAQDRLAKAKTEAAKASGKLETAQLKETERKEQSVAAADRVAAAETNLIDTRDRYGAGTKQTAAAEKELEAAKKAQDAASKQLATAEGNSIKSKAALANASDQVRAKQTHLKAVQAELAEAERKAGDEAESAGGKIRGMGDDIAGAEAPTNSLGGALGGMVGKAALAAGALIGVRGATGFLSGGFDRLMGIQKSEILFQNIGLTAEETSAQMDQLSEQVTGTAVSLSDAAQKSAAFAQAGIEMGAPMDQSIDAFTALSAAAMGSSVDVGSTMQTIAAQGKVTATELNSLSSAGINATAWLAESMGMSMEEVKDAVSAGEVSFEDFVEAVNLGAGDLAQSMGETLPARLSNAKTAFANLAAGVIEPFIEPITTAVEWLTEAVKTVTPIVREMMEGFLENKAVLGIIAGGIGSLVSGMLAYNAVVKVQAGLAAARGFLAMDRAAKRATLAQKGLNLAMLSSPITWVVAAFVAIGAALVWFFTQTEVGKAAWSSFTDFLGSAWERIKGFFSSAWDAIQPIFEWIGDAWNSVKESFTDGAINSALEGIGDAFDLALTPVRWLIDQLRDAWTAGTEAISAKYQENIAPMLDMFRDKWNEAKDIVGPVIEDLKQKWTDFTTDLRAKYDEHIAPAVDAIREKWDELKEKFGSFVSDMWEPVLKPALITLGAILLGPIVIALLAVVAVVGLVVGAIGALIYIVVSLPGWVSSAVEAVKNWFSDMADNVRQWFSDMGDSVTGWWDEHVAPLPGKVSGAVDEIKQWFSDLWTNIKNWFSDMGAAVSGWWNEHVAPLPGNVANAVRDMISEFGKLPGRIRDVFANAGQWLLDAGRRIIDGLWDGIRQRWESVKSWFSNNLSFSAIGSLVGFGSGGVVGYADGGISSYAAGGIEAAERYANGGRRSEDHTAQIAPAGAWRVWAEPETGGEAYIPLAQSKRTRSTAILAETASIMGMSLVDARTGDPVQSTYRGGLGPVRGAVQTFADGGIRTSAEVRRFVEGESVAGVQAERSLDGAPYENYPNRDGAWGDCSYTQANVAAFMLGINPWPRKFATGTQENWLRSNGATIGRGPAGTFRMGWYNGGPYGGHTSGTLPDGTNIEMGGGNGGGAIGRGAVPWDHPSFTNWAWIAPAAGGAGAGTSSEDSLGDLGDLGAADAAAATATASGGTGATGSDPDVGPEPAAIAEAGPQTWSELVGESAKAIASGHFADFLGVIGVPDEIPPLMQAARDLGIAWRDRDGASSQEVVGGESSTGDTAEELAAATAAAELAGDTGLDTPIDPTAPDVGDWGEPFFVQEITRAARDAGLDREAAVIGTGVTIVEVGRALRMLANRAVPESLNYRHDGLGADHDSVGLFQQRNNGAWGTVKERMTPYDSAMMFFNELKKLDWENMGRGVAAQRVQRSAFPDRYEPVMADAEALVDQYGVFGTATAATNTADTTSATAASATAPGDGLEGTDPADVTAAAEAITAAAAEEDDALRLAGGGQVRGPGGPRDDMVRAWLSNGEYVVNAGTSDENLALVGAINAGADIASMVSDQAIETGRAAGHSGISSMAGIARSGVAALGPAAAPLGAGIGVGEAIGTVAVDQLADAAGRMSEAGVSTLADGAANIANSHGATIAPTPSTTPAPNPSAETTSTPQSSPGAAAGPAGPSVSYTFVHRNEEDAWRRFREAQNREAAGFGAMRH